MKLQKFFEQQGQPISEEAKFAIYQKFLEKKQKTGHGFMQRVASFTKKSIYSIVIVAMFVGIFGFLNNEQYTNNLFGDNGFNINSNPDNNYRASADGAGRIEQFNGEYEIKDRNGKSLKTNIIQDGDTITLAEGAYMQAKFNENLAKIIGPARIRVHQTTNENYLVEILEGKFVQIENQDEQKPLQIKKNNVTIAKSQQAKSMKIQITEDQFGETTVKNLGNEGDNISIQDQQEGETTEIIAKHQITIDEKQLIGEDMIAIETSIQSTDEKELEALISLLESKQEETTQIEVDETIDKELDIQIDTKKIPTEGQLAAINNYLKAKFITYELASIIKAINNNNPNEYNIALANFATRIQNIGNTFDISVETDNSLTSIHNNIQTLMQQIPEQYYIPASTTNNLLVASGWITVFKDTENVTRVALDTTKDYTPEELVKAIAEQQEKSWLLIPRTN